MFATSFYTYDRPKTNLDINLQYYPSLSNTGRQRVQLDAGVKREFWKDLSLRISTILNSNPPNPAANTNDAGLTLSVGWSY